MRFRTHAEATQFVKALLAAKEGGARELMGARMDSVPQWVPGPDGKTPLPALDGALVEAVYISYLPATARQKEEAKGAKLSGLKLERISGRLVDVRQVSDGTCQVLLTNGLRNAGDKIPFRGPNVDKGILAAIGLNEGLVETDEEILARVPADLLERLRANKLAMAAKSRARTAVPAGQAELPLDQTQAQPQPQTNNEGRMRLK